MNKIKLNKVVLVVFICVSIICFIAADKSEQHTAELKELIGLTKEQLYSKKGSPKSVIYLNAHVLKLTYPDTAIIIKNGKVLAIWRN